MSEHLVAPNGSQTELARTYPEFGHPAIDGPLGRAAKAYQAAIDDYTNRHNKGEHPDNVMYSDARTNLPIVMGAWTAAVAGEPGPAITYFDNRRTTASKAMGAMRHSPELYDKSDVARYAAAREKEALAREGLADTPVISKKLFDFTQQQIRVLQSEQEQTRFGLLMGYFKEADDALAVLIPNHSFRNNPDNITPAAQSF
jgi:hypothetical protein